MARRRSIAGMWTEAERSIASREMVAPTPLPQTRQIRARLLDGRAHYDDLVARVIEEAKVSVWIATANLKTMLVEAPIGTSARARGRYVSFFERLAGLANTGVEVCILHASAPSGPLATELKRLGKRGQTIRMRCCPRVHLKMIAVDGRELYLGSANLTGAGLGAKGDARRNFEMGIVTDDPAMLDAAQERFHRIWTGAECAPCALRDKCPAPLDVTSKSTRASTRTGSRRTGRPDSVQTGRAK